MRISVISVVGALMVAFGLTVAMAEAGTEELFEFKAGYPTAEASEALYDEMDYQRAVQAYIWATPMLNSMGTNLEVAGF